MYDINKRGFVSIDLILLILGINVLVMVNNIFMVMLNIYNIVKRKMSSNGLLSINVLFSR